MLRDLRFGWLVISALVLALVVACGSDEPRPDDTPVNLSVAQEETDQLAVIEAGLLYQEAVRRVRTRHLETGVYAYIEDEIDLIEQALTLNPGNLAALEVLSWVYSTYPEYLNDDAAHEIALEYALALFEANAEFDVLAYEILAAAYYANGDYDQGGQLFDQGIERAIKEEVIQLLITEKESLRKLHEDRFTEPANSQ
jgi:tetratricopeptide (TPR) repeat protein